MIICGYFNIIFLKIYGKDVFLCRIYGISYFFSILPKGLAKKDKRVYNRIKDFLEVINMNHLRTNEQFLEAFISLESYCAEKLGITTAGVSEYITRLTDARMAYGRDDTLNHLHRYRKIRNRLVHENGALRSLGEINKLDIKWIKNFEKSVRKNKDPLSSYYKSTSDSRKKKKITAWLVTIAIAMVIAAICYVITQI